MPVPAAAVITTTLPASRLVPGRRLHARRLPGQAERALGDDVPLDLVRPAVDRVGPAEQVQPLPLVQLATSPARRATIDAAPRTCIASSPSALCHRDHSSFKTERLGGLVPAGSASMSSAYARITSQADPGPGEPVAQQRVRPRPGPPRQRRSARRARAGTRPAGPASPPRARCQRRHRDPPAVAGRRRPCGRAPVRAPSKNTSLNSDVPVSCRIGRTVIPGCRIGTSR